MTAKPAQATRGGFLTSWDRLGFRLLFFGGLALFWIVQGRIMGNPWSTLIWGELMGIMPWTFIAPLVLSWDARVRARRPGRAAYLAAHVIGMLLVFVPLWLMQRGVDSAWAWTEAGRNFSYATVWLPTKKNVLGSFINVPFIYLLLLIGAEAMRQARARHDEELQAERLAGQLSEARLSLLQRQLHPHFLFNALQAISTLLHRDPATADRLLVRLSSLLRAMLDDASGQTLPLATELDLVRKYLEIEQARFQERLCVEWRVDPATLDAEVPSLILLPLVENAIRHGLAPKIGPGRLRLVTLAEDGWLTLSVEDEGLGATLPLSLGVGLSNTAERLRAHFGDDGQLDFNTRPDAGFRARIRMPYRKAHA